MPNRPKRYKVPRVAQKITKALERTKALAATQHFLEEEQATSSPQSPHLSSARRSIKGSARIPRGEGRRRGTFSADGSVYRWDGRFQKDVPNDTDGIKVIQVVQGSKSNTKKSSKERTKKSSSPSEYQREVVKLKAQVAEGRRELRLAKVRATDSTEYFRLLNGNYALHKGRKGITFQNWVRAVFRRLIIFTCRKKSRQSPAVIYV